MKKHYAIAFTFILLLCMARVNAQVTVVIGAGSSSGTASNGATGDCGPIYRSSATSSFIYSRHHYLYTQSELSAAGIQPGMRISKLSWNKDNAEAFTGPAAFEIWIKNSTLTAVQTPPQTWSTLISGSTQVYNSPTTLTSTIGYVDFNFTAPFLYTGGALEISTAYDHSAVSSPWSTLGLSWKKDASTGTTISYVGSSASTTLGNARTVRPQLKFTILPSSAANDVGVSALVAPLQFCASSQNVKVRINNYGRNIVDSLTVQWKLDGVMQSPINWNSRLDTINGPAAAPSDTAITLGSVTFGTTARQIVVWTEAPNSQTDTVTSNDTLTVTLKSALSGTYTIGGSGDYTSFTAAVADLNSYGVCGPVTFNVAAGTFTERITFNQISGSSATNTVTFIGAGKTSTTLTYAGTSTADFATVLLNGADYVTFRDMTIAATNVTNGVGVLLTAQADNNAFRNLKIQMNTTSTATTTAGIASSGALTAVTTVGDNASNCIFDSLDIDGAYYGIALSGSSATVFNANNRITNCTFTNQYYYGVRIAYQNAPLVQNNRIGPFRNTSTYAIYSTYSSNYTIHGNTMQAANVGLYMLNSNTNNYNPALATIISNNLMAGGSSYACYFSTAANVKVVHNSFLSTGTTGTMYFSSGTNFNVRNNIVVNTNTGANSVMYIAAAITFDTLDYNNYFSSGSGFVTGGTVYASLAAWKSAVPAYNANSMSVNPVFTSATNLHLTNTSPYMLGLNLGLPRDIDGEIRLYRPYMGADEPSRKNNSMGITAVTAPTTFCAGSQDIKINLINNGINVVNNVGIFWELDGVAQTPVAWTNPIDTLGGATRNDTTITLATVAFTAGVARTIKVWTSGPNSATDSVNWDDTVFVTKKSGLSGTLSVGPTGAYTTLTAAMADLQNGVCGPVTLELQAAYTSASETFPLVINPVGLSSTNNLVIRPQTGATGLVITSSNAVTTLDLVGAKYVTIDGRPGGTGAKELTITNTSTTGSAIRFVNDAQNCRLTNITAVASNASATSGVIMFGGTTGTLAANGNSNNVIDSCSINGNSASATCIYSQGSAAPADNKSNTITNCNIYDFFQNVATNVSGIALQAGNSDWNIGTTGNGNNFYQTAARTPTSTPALTVAATFKAILINDASVGGCSIVGNRIGGNIPGISGSTFVLGGAGSVGQTLWCIDNSVSSTTSATSIQGNTISDITFYSSVSNGFIGIHGRSGLVNTGNITGNTIGSATGTGNIKIYHIGTANGANAYAIRYATAAGLVQNNICGSMTAETQNTGTMQLLVIYVSGASPAPLTISNNFVGSAVTPHSIQSAAASTAGINVMGLCASAATGAQITFANNTVMNLSSLCPASTTANGLKGIYVTGASSVGTTISGNTVSKLYSMSTNTGADQTTAVVGITDVATGAGPQVVSDNTVRHLMSGVTTNTAVNVTGIYYGSATTAASGNRIERNTISGFAVGGTNVLGVQNGISIGAGTARVQVVNNMISLGIDTGSNSFTGASPIYGLYKWGGIASYLYNTVSIGGTGVGTNTANTFAFWSNTSSADTIMNNIFVNDRLNQTTGGTHYAISLTTAAGLMINSNLYKTSNGPLGLFASVSQSTLPAWKSATAQDVNSMTSPVFFVSPTNLHLTGSSIGNAWLAGTPLTAYTTDYDGQTRHATYPYMGADENTATPLPVTLLDLHAQAAGRNARITWSTATEQNADRFIVEASADGSRFEAIGSVKAVGNSEAISSYGLTHQGAETFAGEHATVLYRLNMVDADGRQEYSRTVSVRFGTSAGTAVSVMPNPCSEKAVMAFDATQAGTAVIEVTDIRGRMMLAQTSDFAAGHNAIELGQVATLDAGIYLVRITMNGESSVQKLVKQ